MDWSLRFLRVHETTRPIADFRPCDVVAIAIEGESERQVWPIARRQRMAAFPALADEEGEVGSPACEAEPPLESEACSSASDSSNSSDIPDEDFEVVDVSGGRSVQAPLVGQLSFRQCNMLYDCPRCVLTCAPYNGLGFEMYSLFCGGAFFSALGGGGVAQFGSVFGVYRQPQHVSMQHGDRPKTPHACTGREQR